MIQERTVQSRIMEGIDGEYILIERGEADIYRGAGWHLAAFGPGARLHALHNIGDFEVEDLSDPAGEASRGSKVAYDWAQSQTKEGREVWLVMCSGGDFYEPRPFRPEMIATIARLLADSMMS